MAVQTTNATDNRPSSRFLDGLLALMNRIGQSSPAGRCAAEAKRLDGLSDPELAKLGLTRDQIVRHAFARFIPL